MNIGGGEDGCVYYVDASLIERALVEASCARVPASVDPADDRLDLNIETNVSGSTISCKVDAANLMMRSSASEPLLAQPNVEATKSFGAQRALDAYAESALSENRNRITSEKIDDVLRAGHGCILWPRDDLGSSDTSACVEWIVEAIAESMMPQWISAIWLSFKVHYELYTAPLGKYGDGANAAVALEALADLVLYKRSEVSTAARSTLVGADCVKYLAAEIGLKSVQQIQEGAISVKSAAQRKVPPPSTRGAQKPPTGSAVATFRLHNALKLNLNISAEKGATNEWATDRFARIVNRGNSLDIKVHTSMLVLLFSLFELPAGFSEYAVDFLGMCRIICRSSFLEKLMRPSLHPSVVACTTGEYSSFCAPSTGIGSRFCRGTELLVSALVGEDLELSIELGAILSRKSLMTTPVAEVTLLMSPPK